MEQPAICEANGSRKQCWACRNYIPYAFGYCAECWAVLSEAEQALLGYSAFLAPALGGAIRVALTQHVQAIRRPKPSYSPRIKEVKERRKLPDINLNLEDLEI